MVTRSQWGLGLLLFGVALGCHKSESPASNNPAGRPAAPPAPLVTAVDVTRVVMKEQREFTGRTAATEQVEVRARVSGTLLKSPSGQKVKSENIAGEEDQSFQVSVREGDLVEVDTPLFEIDPAPYRNVLAQAQGSLAAKQAQLKRLEAEVQRADDLRKTNAISKAEYDLALSDWAETQAQVATLNAQVQQAELDLKFTKVVAPIRGVLGRNSLTPGNLVSADSSLLSTIVSIDPIQVYFEVDENSLLEYREKVRSGELEDPTKIETKIYMGLGNEEGFPHEGVIDFIEPSNDARTGSTVLRGTFPNRDGILRPGLFARVQVAFSQARPTLVVSTVALAMDQQGRYVYVVDAALKVERRGVKVGSIQGKVATVVEGLMEGEKVITSGLQRVRPGVTVNLEPASALIPGLKASPTSPASSPSASPAPSGVRAKS